MTVLHSAEFIERWKSMLYRLYDYRFEGDFAVVPTFFGTTSLVYLPLLNYTDRSVQECKMLALQAEGKNHQLRALNSQCDTFAKNDTVTMRLDMDGLDEQSVWQKRLDAKCRNQVRKAQKCGLYVEKGDDKKLLDDFYSLFLSTMRGYGTPAFKKEFFELLLQDRLAQIYIAYTQDAQAAAGIVVVDDLQLSWVGWGASNECFLSLCPNNLLYYEAIKDATAQNKAVFDFGRSGFGGNTFQFKSHFGAKPVKIEIIKPQTENVYSKYEAASSVWRRLPSCVTDYIGPKLCRYLADL